LHRELKLYKNVKIIIKFKGNRVWEEFDSNIGLRLKMEMSEEERELVAYSV
jgi:hypothetical protein